MSTAQNLSYAIVQIAHNFGAVAVVGASAVALAIKNTKVRSRLAWIALAGWSTQAISGLAFGAVSYYFYHQFPDIAGVAVYALIIKLFCVAIGVLLLIVYLIHEASWQDKRNNTVWLASVILSITALSAAAFLRWFS